jgi:KaiC/GvpD/RAD55 family RecA-like ATPase
LIRQSITLVAGEAGIGKSVLLEEFYNRLCKTDPPTLLIGFYDRNKSLIGESQSLLYPFIVVLESLVKYAKETERFNEKLST